MRRYNIPPLPTCLCGRLTKMKTSWTSKNPGRRYAICAAEEDGCGFWNWVDEEMCRRSVQLIPGLLNKINATEKERDEFETAARRWEAKAENLRAKVKELEKEIYRHKLGKKGLLMVVIVTWIVILLIVFGFGQKNEKFTGMKEIEGAL